MQLVGSHYQAGYDYGALLGPEMVDNYNIFLGSVFNSKLEKKVLEAFLDWQFETYIKPEIPHDFIE